MRATIALPAELGYHSRCMCIVNSGKTRRIRQASAGVNCVRAREESNPQHGVTQTIVGYAMSTAYRLPMLAQSRAIGSCKHHVSRPQR